MDKDIKDYNYTGWCKNCMKNTPHHFIDGGHERDSSNDYFECYECGELTHNWDFEETE